MWPKLPAAPLARLDFLRAVAHQERTPKTVQQSLRVMRRMRNLLRYLWIIIHKMKSFRILDLSGDLEVALA